MGTPTRNGIYAALRQMSVGTVLTIVFGVATNKILALVAGTEGVALIGLYRYVTTITTTILPLGMTNVVVQRLSTAGSRAQVLRVLQASFFLVVAQTVATLAIAWLFALPIARILFGANTASEHVVELQWVIGLSTGVLLLQATIALLNAKAAFREAMRTTLFTSAATLLTTYPFLRLGHIGLAFMIGATCFLGAGLGAWYVWRINELRLDEFSRPQSARDLLRDVPISLSATLQPLATTGSAIAVQALVTRHYGLDALGLLNAAALLETTSVMVLMASMRSYFLPTLGKLGSVSEKAALVERMMNILLLLAVPGVLILIFGGPIIVRVLYTSAFGAATQLVAVLGVSVAAQAFVWCYAMVLIHYGDFRTYLLLDTIWAVLRVAGTLVCVRRHLPLVDIVWVYTAVYSFSGMLYVLVVRFRHGPSYIAARTVTLGMSSAAVLIAGYAVWSLHSLAYNVMFLLAAFTAWGLTGLQTLRSLRIV